MTSVLFTSEMSTGPLSVTHAPDLTIDQLMMTQEVELSKYSININSELDIARFEG